MPECGLRFFSNIGIYMIYIYIEREFLVLSIEADALSEQVSLSHSLYFCLSCGTDTSCTTNVTSDDII